MSKKKPMNKQTLAKHLVVEEKESYFPPASDFAKMFEEVSVEGMNLVPNNLCPPSGYRLLKEGEIIPDLYIYYFDNKWTFACDSDFAGQKYTTTIHDGNHTWCPIARSIFTELADNVQFISAELKRSLSDSINVVACMEAEDLGGLIMQAILCGDFFKNIHGAQYVPNKLSDELTKLHTTLEKRYKDLEDKYHSMKGEKMSKPYAEEPPKFDVDNDQLIDDLVKIMLTDKGSK